MLVMVFSPIGLVWMFKFSVSFGTEIEKKTRPWHGCFTAVTTNTRPQRVFSSVQTCVLVDVNQPLPWFFTRWPREDSFSVSWALGRICRRFSRFCNILLQDLTPLHVKITRRKNLLSVSRRKLTWDQALFSFRFVNNIPAGMAKRKERPNFSGGR